MMSYDVNTSHILLRDAVVFDIVMKDFVVDNFTYPRYYQQAVDNFLNISPAPCFILKTLSFLFHTFFTTNDAIDLLQGVNLV